MNDTLPIGGVEYPAIFVKSGYYFDKATLSDVVLSDMLSKVTTIDKPNSLGTVELPDFSTIDLMKTPKIEVDSAMVEAEIERERDSETVYNPVKTKREAKLTDKVIIDFKGYVDEELLEGGNAEDYELILGSNQFIPGFEEQVVGHTAGKKFNINVTFPTEYDPSLAGKPARFEIVIKSIEEATTPSIDEEFVKRHTNEKSTNVEEYKEEVSRRIEKKNEFASDQSLIYQLTNELLEKSKFEPTEEALAWQFANMIVQYQEYYGTSFDSIVNEMGGEMTVTDLYKTIKDSTELSLQPVMIMEELEKKYKVSVTEKDVKEWWNLFAEVMGYNNQITYEEYVEYVGYDNLKNECSQEKLLVLASKDCNIIETEEQIGEINY